MPFFRKRGSSIIIGICLLSGLAYQTCCLFVGCKELCKSIRMNKAVLFVILTSILLFNKAEAAWFGRRRRRYHHHVVYVIHGQVLMCCVVCWSISVYKYLNFKNKQWGVNWLLYVRKLMSFPKRKVPKQSFFLHWQNSRQSKNF